MINMIYLRFLIDAFYGIILATYLRKENMMKSVNIKDWKFRQQTLAENRSQNYVIISIMDPAGYWDPAGENSWYRMAKKIIPIFLFVEVF